MVKYVARHCMCCTSTVHYSANKCVQHTSNAKPRREQMRATYFSSPAIRSLRSIPFNSVLKAGGLSRAGSERAWQHSEQPTNGKKQNVLGLSRCRVAKQPNTDGPFVFLSRVFVLSLIFSFFVLYY